jgi:hypothetical protein
VRDVTPEATLAVAHKVMPGFGEQMRQISLNFVPTAILSRQVAVIRGNSLIINLPGQPKSVAQTLEGLKDEAGAVQVPGIFAAVPLSCLASVGRRGHPGTSVNDCCAARWAGGVHLNSTIKPLGHIGWISHDAGGQRVMQWALARAERSLIDVEVVAQHLEGELRAHRSEGLNVGKLLGSESRDLRHIEAHHGDWPLRAEDKVCRLGIVPNVGFSGSRGVPLVGDCATHHHNGAHAPSELWLKAEGEAEVGEWANGE